MNSCKRCGILMKNGADLCDSCAMRASELKQMERMEIKTYLAESIFVTILCCLPLGIPAIAYAAKAASCLAVNHPVAAREASDKAKAWCLVSFFIGLILGALGLIARYGKSIAN